MSTPPDQCPVCHKHQPFNSKTGADDDDEEETVRPHLPSSSSEDLSSLKRCQACHRAWYCSRCCQRQDWPRHRKACRRWAAERAWTEMSHLVTTAPLSDLQQDYHLALDHKKAEEQRQQQQLKERPNKAEQGSVGSKKKNPNSQSLNPQLATSRKNHDSRQGTETSASTSQPKQPKAVVDSTAEPRRHRNFFHYFYTTAQGDPLPTGTQEDTVMDTIQAESLPDDVYRLVSIEDMPRLGSLQISLLRRRDPWTKATSSQEANPIRNDGWAFEQVTLSLQHKGFGLYQMQLQIQNSRVSLHVDVPPPRPNLHYCSPSSAPHRRLEPVKDGSCTVQLPRQPCASGTLLTLPLAYDPILTWDVADDGVDYLSSAFHEVTLDMIPHLACRSCHQKLFPEEITKVPSSTPDISERISRDDLEKQHGLVKVMIDRVLPLPAVGHWEELVEFISCTSSPLVDALGSIESTQARPSALLYDATTLVAHATHFQSTVCTLASSCIPGYGQSDELCEFPPRIASLETSSSEKTISSSTNVRMRGRHTWRDVVGGDPLCCSRCCSVLGFAPPTLTETYRILKHRLVFLTPESRPAETTLSVSPSPRVPFVSTFLAHEMIRYVQTQAIFRWTVHHQDTTSAVDPPMTKPSLKLHLLNWNSMTADLSERKDWLRSGVESKTISYAQLGRAAKILFQVVEEETLPVPPSWYSWQQDWCCPPRSSFGRPISEKKAIGDPPNTTEPQVTNSVAIEPAVEGTETPSAPHSSVEIWLSKEEWQQLHQELIQLTSYQSLAAVDAAFISTMGRLRSSDDSTLGSSGMAVVLI